MKKKSNYKKNSLALFSKSFLLLTISLFLILPLTQFEIIQKNLFAKSSRISDNLNSKNIHLSPIVKNGKKIDFFKKIFENEKNREKLYLKNKEARNIYSATNNNKKNPNNHQKYVDYNKNLLEHLKNKDYNKIYSVVKKAISIEDKKYF